MGHMSKPLKSSSRQPTGAAPMTEHGADASIRLAFSRFDVDKSGAIDTNEFQSLLKELGVELSMEESQSVICALDNNQSGKIDMEEFTKWWTNKSSDLDGDGQIGALEQVMERIKAIGQERFQADIHTACWEGYLDVVESLIEDPQAVNKPDDTEFGENNTPLHYAAYNGHESICELLLRNKADVKARNYAGVTPIFLASQQDHQRIVSILLKHGSDCTVPDKEHGLTCIDVADSPEVIELFRDVGGSKPNTPPRPSLEDPTYKSLQLKWEPAEQPRNNPVPISGYKICLKMDGCDKICKVMLVRAHPFCATISHLEPNTSYRAQIAAVNVHGSGQYSEPSMICSTKAAPPRPPLKIEVEEVSATEINLKIEMEPQDLLSKCIIQRCMEKSSPWETIAKVAAESSMSYTVSKLFRGTFYLFRACIVNENGRGKFCKSVSHTTTKIGNSHAGKLRKQIAAVKAFSKGLSEKKPEGPQLQAKNTVGKRPDQKHQGDKDNESPDEKPLIPPSTQECTNEVEDNSDGKRREEVRESSSGGSLRTLRSMANSSRLRDGKAAKGLKDGAAREEGEGEHPSAYNDSVVGETAQQKREDTVEQDRSIILDSGCAKDGTCIGRTGTDFEPSKGYPESENTKHEHTELGNTNHRSAHTPMETK